MNFLDILGLIALIIFLVGSWAAVWLQVPPLPSRAVELAEAFELAKIQPSERVFDLGAGEGLVMRQARDKYGARVSGWEINPIVWILGKLKTGLHSDLRFANLWKAPVEEADVVFVFLMKSLMAKVEEEIWARMKPGARLVSNSFAMPNVTPSESRDGVFLYRKPSIG